MKSLTTKPAPQNEEAAILSLLLATHDVPECFIEFGFSGWEFNCASLAQTWEGLLLDADSYNVAISRTILPRRIKAEAKWLTLESMDFIRDYAAAREIGILSIDVDGNDHWFLESLIGLRPAIIVSEYNAVFGRRPITVPYDPQFDRRTRSPDWSYYGASLTALTHLAESNGYRLISLTETGANAFFLRADLLNKDDIVLDAAAAFVDRPFWNGKLPSECWAAIAHFPYVDVTGRH